MTGTHKDTLLLKGIGEEENVPTEQSIVRKRLVKTAYHEAGHAVAALVKTVPYKYVTILPDEESQSLGHILQDGKFVDYAALEAGELTPTKLNRIERYLMVLLAGGLAEKGYSGRYNQIGASSDRYKAADIALSLEGDGEGASLYLGLLNHRTKAVIGNHWRDVVTVAEALLSRQTLTSEEVRQVVNESWGLGDFKKPSPKE